MCLTFGWTFRLFELTLKKIGSDLSTGTKSRYIQRFKHDRNVLKTIASFIDVEGRWQIKTPNNTYHTKLCTVCEKINRTVVNVFERRF